MLQKSHHNMTLNLISPNIFLAISLYCCQPRLVLTTLLTEKLILPTEQSPFVDSKSPLFWDIFCWQIKWVVTFVSEKAQSNFFILRLTWIYFGFDGKYQAITIINHFPQAKCAIFVKAGTRCNFNLLWLPLPIFVFVSVSVFVFVSVSIFAFVFDFVFVFFFVFVSESRPHSVISIFCPSQVQSLFSQETSRPREN